MQMPLHGVCAFSDLRPIGSRGHIVLLAEDLVQRFRCLVAAGIGDTVDGQGGGFQHVFGFGQAECLDVFQWREARVFFEDHAKISPVQSHVAGDIVHFQRLRDVVLNVGDGLLHVLVAVGSGQSVPVGGGDGA